MREKRNMICGYCQTSHVVYDEYKGELFCLDCGLIFAENYKIFSIVDYEEKVKQREAEGKKKLMSEC